MDVSALAFIVLSPQYKSNFRIFCLGLVSVELHFFKQVDLGKFPPTYHYLIINIF